MSNSQAKIRRLLQMLLTVLLLARGWVFLATGCSSADGRNGTDAELTGAARLAITAPTGVQSVQVSFTGNTRNVTRCLRVDGAATTLVQGLPTNTVRVGAAAYASTSCTGDAIWLADDQTVQLVAGQQTAIQLVFHPNGEVQIGTNFESDTNGACSNPIDSSLGADAGCGTPQPPPEPVSATATTEQDGVAQFVIPDTNIRVIATVVDENQTPVPEIAVSLFAAGSDYLIVATDATVSPQYGPVTALGSLLDARPEPAPTLRLALALSFLPQLCQVRVSNGVPLPKPNGCTGDIHQSYSIIAPFIGLADFRPACNLHDLCYDNCNSAKVDCDTAFLANLTQACLSVPNAAVCLPIATQFYSAVSLIGLPFYVATQNRVCKCCGAGEVNCADACTTVSSDPENCGSCGNVCSAQGTCVGGRCDSSAGGSGGTGGANGSGGSRASGGSSATSASGGSNASGGSATSSGAGPSSGSNSGTGGTVSVPCDSPMVLCGGGCVDPTCLGAVFNSTTCACDNVTCNWGADHLSKNFPSSGGQDVILIATNFALCGNGNPNTPASWIHLGPTTLVPNVIPAEWSMPYTVDANRASTARQAQIGLGNRLFTVTQDGVAGGGGTGGGGGVGGSGGGGGGATTISQTQPTIPLASNPSSDVHALNMSLAASGTKPYDLRLSVTTSCAQGSVTVWNHTTGALIAQVSCSTTSSCFNTSGTRTCTSSTPISLDKSNAYDWVLHLTNGIDGSFLSVGALGEVITK